MWNAASPFEEIELVHFDSLEQLEGIFERIELKDELT
jgi:hypothetical protein